MRSISKTACVLTAAALVALVAAGCRGGKREDEVLQAYTESNLAELNGTARGFVTRKVRFDAYYIQRTDLYPTFPTPFNRTDYINFSVWPRGARLWKAEEIKLSYPQMYVGRHAGGVIDRKNIEPLKVLDKLEKYQPITICGTVVQDNNGYAWVVVDHFRLLPGTQYSDAIIRRLKLADENYAAKEFAVATKDYRKALEVGVPKEVRGWAHKNLGQCHLALEKWAGAARELGTAVAMGAGDAECLIALAEVQCAVGKPAAAEKNARAALRKNPRSAQARAQLAVALGLLKRYNAALEECTEALKRAPTDADVLRAKGMVLDMTGRLDEGIKSYQEAVNSRPGDPRLHREIGQLFVKKGQLKKAREYFENVVSQSASQTFRYCRGCCLLAGVLEALGEPKEAVRYYRLAEQRDETYLPAYMGLAPLYAAGGRYDDALKQFAVVAKRLDPKGGHGFKAWRGMAAVNQRKAEKEKDPAALAAAAKCYEGALKIKPDHYDSWLDLAVTRRELVKPDHKAALQALAECVKLKPDQARPHYLAGCSLEELGDLNGAARELEAAKRLDPMHARTLHRLGVVYRKLGTDTRALPELRAALKLDPKDLKLKLSIKNSLAYALADFGRGADLAEAEKLAGEVVAARKDVAAYIDVLGWAQARAGKLRVAEKTLRGAAAKAPKEGAAEVFYHLGYVLAALKKYKEAIATLEKADLRFTRSGRKHAQAARLQGAARTLLSKTKAEKASIEAERRRRVGAVGDPGTQRSSPRRRRRPKPKKDEKDK